MTDTTTDGGHGGAISGRERALVLAAFVVQAVLLAWAATRHTVALNPDGVAYLQVARHYADGNVDLAVNGYWGPLISWVLVPLLWVIDDPRLAARAVMALSGVVFLLGSTAFLRRAGLRGAALVGGVWIAALAGVAWSVPLVTPDLFLGGLFALAASVLIRADWVTSSRVQVTAGLLLGVAYYSKAAALPAGVVCVFALAALAWWTGAADRRTALLAVVRTGAGAAVLALPWIAMLSAHYGRFVFSTTGKIAHSVVGPGDVERWYPTFTTLHAPPAGRITSWEDPTYLAYELWSPFESLGLLRHQLRVVLNNAQAVAGYVAELDLLALGLCLTLVAFLVHAPWKENLRAHRWRLALIPLACMGGLYLPVFAYDGRYYWALLPFLLAGALGFASTAGGAAAPRALRRTALGLVIASFAFALVSWDIPGYPHSVPARPGLIRALRTGRNLVVEESEDLARRLRRAGIEGPVAGDSRHGLYTAYFLGGTCHGQIVPERAAELATSGARVLLVKGDPVAADALAASADYRDAGAELYEDSGPPRGLRVLVRTR